MSTNTIIENSWNIQIECFPKLNFSLQQSNIPFIKNISINNNTDDTKNNIKLQVSSTPEFISPKTFEISSSESKKSFLITPIDIKLNYDFFSTLSEKVNGILKLKLIVANNNQEEILAEKEVDIDSFPANTWTGFNPMPQLLAAFVTPNLNSITKIQSQMSLLLAKNGLNDALSGYQSSKAHVKEIIQAAYNVIATQQISYSESPASFTGQRIRFVQEVLNEKLANCLDISLVFAGILEQCGLHPIVLLTTTHAFVGCHAIDTTFYDAFFEDLQAIRKKATLDEIFVFEATCALGFNPAPFEYAENIAKDKLNIDNFEGALDITQARKEHFMPLPLK